MNSKKNYNKRLNEYSLFIKLVGVIEVLFIAVHFFALIFTIQASWQRRRYIVIFRSITFTYKSSVFVAKLIKYLIIHMTLSTFIFGLLYISVINYLFNIGYATVFVMMIVATEYNCVLRRFCLLTSLAYVIPR